MRPRVIEYLEMTDIQYDIFQLYLSLLGRQFLMIEYRFYFGDLEMPQKKIAIVGAGLSGAVVAHQLSAAGTFDIEVFESKGHLAGNCYTYRDASTGVLVHEYGPHIFHTKRKDVWDFVSGFVTFGPFTNRVKAHTAKGVFSLPINLLTINQFFGKHMNPAEAAVFLKQIGDSSIVEPQNFEEQALKFVGRELYENFFYGYTVKQWGVEPTELPASILQRLPIRFNYDDNYYADPFQGIPVEGYTVLVEKLLTSPKIKVHLKTPFSRKNCSEFDHVFYAGTLDGFFGFQLGRLGYRSIGFERFEANGDYQGNPVINYCEAKVPYTRIAEHKHFAPWESFDRTVCFREFSKATGEDDVPFYPMRLSVDKQLIAKYIDLAAKEEKVTFMGRLGTYRYLDMDTCIGEALDLAQHFLKWDGKSGFTGFSRHPLDGSAFPKRAS